MLMGITISISLGILMVVLYMVPLKILRGIPSADLDFSLFMLLQTVILEHFNCTLILKWKLSHLVLV
jgi:hypothetical protein